MKLTLPHFGSDEVEIDPATLIEFPHGLPGFEDCIHFKLFHSADSPLVFWLQSIDDPSVVFSLTDPASLHVSYEMLLTDDELGSLQFSAGDELQIAVILTLQDEDLAAARNTVAANYTSPIVINVSKQIALQKILPNSELSTCTYQPSSEAAQATVPYLPEVSQIRSMASDNLCSLAQ